MAVRTIDGSLNIGTDKLPRWLVHFTYWDGCNVMAMNVTMSFVAESCVADSHPVPPLNVDGLLACNRDGVGVLDAWLVVGADWLRWHVS